MKKRLFILLVMGLTLGACSNSNSKSSDDKVIASVEVPEALKTVTPTEQVTTTQEKVEEVTNKNPELNIQKDDIYEIPTTFKTTQTGTKAASPTGDTVKSEASDKTVEVTGIVNSGVKANKNETNALFAKNGGVILNNGTLEGNGSGVDAKGGTIINGVNGKINTTGKYMMRAEEDGLVINLGTLSNNTKDKTVLYAKGAKAINLKEGNITVDNGAIGMYSEEANSKNVNYGTITLNGHRTRGMRANGEGAIVENRGIIVVNGDGNRGMYAEKGGTAYNYGTIDLTNSKDGRGIYADGKGTIVENTGTIYLSGAVIDNGNNDYRDASENRAFEIKNGATLKNTGKVTIK